MLDTRMKNSRKAKLIRMFEFAYCPPILVFSRYFSLLFFASFLMKYIVSVVVICQIMKEFKCLCQICSATIWTVRSTYCLPGCLYVTVCVSFPFRSKRTIRRLLF